MMGVRWKVVWRVGRMVVGIMGIQGVDIHGVSVGLSGWCMSFLSNCLSHLFGMWRSCDMWKINSFFRVRLEEGIAGKVGLVGNHCPSDCRWNRGRCSDGRM